MKKKYRFVMAKVSIFWRYFAFLLFIMILLLTAWKYSSNRLSDNLRHAYLEQVENSFYANVVAFSDDISRIQALPTSLSYSNNFNKAASAKLPSQATDHYYFSQVRETLSAQRRILVFPEECFVYFKNSQTVVASNRLFLDGAQCFTEYLHYDEMDDIWYRLQQTRVVNEITALPSTSVRIGSDTREVVTFLLSDGSPMTLYGVLYPTNKLLQNFHLESLPEDTYFELRTNKDVPLLVYGQSPEDPSSYVTFSAEVASLRSQVTLALPASYFDGIIHQANRQINTLFFFVSIAGTLFCVFFSLNGAVSLRRIIKNYNPQPSRVQNELVTIEKLVKEKHSDNQQLNELLLSSVLVRMAAGIPILEREIQRLQPKLHIFEDHMRIAVVRCENSPDAFAGGHLVEFVRRSLPQNFICEHLGDQEVCLIFDADLNTYEILRTTLQKWNSQQNKHMRYVCGASAPFLGLRELSSAIRQAQFSVPAYGETTMGVYLMDEEALDAGEHDFDLATFQQELGSWNQESCSQLLSDYIQKINLKDRETCEEVFYSILFQIRSVARENKLELNQEQSLSYQHDLSPRRNLLRLSQLLEELFLQKTEQKSMQKQQVCEEVLDYIRSAYTDPMLSVASVAQTLHVSERFVSNAILTVGNTSFSKLLQALRMEEAARQLRETDLELSDIAEHCGYPAMSSFYRNFKNYYHMTPAAYRATAQENRQ